MRIMCLNGWGGTLHDKIVPYLAESAPDILCLQEVIRTPGCNHGWLTYRDGHHILPQRADFFCDIADVLPDHVGIFCPAVQGVLWHEDQPFPSQSGLATFVHKSYPIISQIQKFVHLDYSPHGYGEHPRPRNAHGVRIYDYQQERSVSITHMHGLRDMRGKMDTPERAAQTRRLLDCSSLISEPDDAVIICGDFNVEPQSETLEILRDAGMSELVTGRGFDGTRNSYYQKPGRFADYMMVNDKVEVLDFQVVSDPEVSDHCPLILEI